MTRSSPLIGTGGNEEPAMDAQQRLALVVETMRDMSRQTDPQSMVRSYAARARRLLPIDRTVSLSRRGLEYPWYRITRSDLFAEAIDPWRFRDRLPLLKGGLLATLIYGDEPRIINDLQVADDDSAAEQLQGMRSLVAIPHFDGGVGLNMVLHMRRPPGAFDEEEFPQLVLMSNLFGRATHNLVLSRELHAAYEMVDRELRTVADIQRSLLPVELPCIEGLDLAAYYQTSHRAGGDYYDFFPQPDGRSWGILIADVSGHGTPAAVMMAITHAIAHEFPRPACDPGELLSFVNDRLAQRYTTESGHFVTACYAIYDPDARELTYATAGHPPPRLRRAGADGSAGQIVSLDASRGMPLGIDGSQSFEHASVRLAPGDELLMYTDGITETFSPAREMFGISSLDEALCVPAVGPQERIDAILAAVQAFAGSAPAGDDRTLLAFRVKTP